MVAMQRQGSGGQARSVLRQRIEARGPEIEQAFLTRSFAISDPAEVPDPQYVGGLRAAIAAALDFALAGIESGEDRAPPPPVALLAQARLAARHGISLDTILRRYFACYALLTDFIVDEAERDPTLQGAVLKSQLRAGGAIFDRLIAAISEEYVREQSQRSASSEQIRSEQVERLLRGELVDTSALNYDFDGYHVGLVVSGQGARETLRAAASALDCRLLSISRPEGAFWAWFGRRAPIDPVEFGSHLESSCPEPLAVSFGEPGECLPGWRTTHRQATAAFAVSLRQQGSIVRYADVVLLAAALQDDLLSASLRDLYLAPLERARDGGKSGRETLRAYFAAHRNVSSAAAALGISRQTVNSRLRSIEEFIDRSIDDCIGELRTAVKLEELTDRVGG